MKEKTKRERALKKNLELLEKLGGIKLDADTVRQEVAATRVGVSDSLEGVLVSIRRPGDYTYRLCKRCRQPFGSNYISVGYCSDICRIRDFEELTGCKWNHHKSQEERWGGEPPLIIPPEVVKAMLAYSMRILAEAERLGLPIPRQDQPIFVDCEEIHSLSDEQASDPSEKDESDQATSPELPDELTPFSL